MNRRYSSGVKKKIGRSAVRAASPVSDQLMRRTFCFSFPQKREHRPYIRKNFMQSSMEHYMQIMKQTNMEMALELDKMPIGKFQYAKIDESVFAKNILKLFLPFRPAIVSIICFRVVARKMVMTPRIVNDTISVVMCRRCCCVFAIKNGKSRTCRNPISCSNTVS